MPENTHSKMPTWLLPDLISTFVKQEQETLFAGCTVCHDGHKSLFAIRRLPIANDAASVGVVCNTQEFIVAIHKAGQLSLRDIFEIHEGRASLAPAIGALDAVFRQTPSVCWAQALF